MKEERKETLFTILLVLLTLVPFILSQIFKGQMSRFAYLDNLMYTPAVFAWLYFGFRAVSGRLYRRLFLAGGALSIAGHFFNIIVSVANNGGFPIYGYSQDEFISLATRPFHFIADNSAPLYIFGDLRIFNGYSAGDLIIIAGLLLITVALLPFLFRKAGEMLE